MAKSSSTSSNQSARAKAIATRTKPPATHTAASPKGKNSRDQSKERLESDIKGHLLEAVAAQFHESFGSVTTRARVPTIRNPKRTREIDLLLEGQVCGYPVRIAVECKNEKKPVGEPKLEGFLGKLQAVGIPASQGIYISATGFTKDAIERAQEVGIRIFHLTGLAEDRLSAAIVEAFQSIVYTLCIVDSIEVQNDTAVQMTPPQLHTLYWADGETYGNLHDLVWEAWRKGKAIPNTLGEHRVRIIPPEGMHHLVDGAPSKTHALTASVRILGLVITFRGKAQQFSLIDATSGVVDRLRINVSFESPIPSQEVPVATFNTEAELEAGIQRPDGVSVTLGRVRLPRIVAGPMFWPPSKRAMIEVAEIGYEMFLSGATEPPQIDFNSIERGGLEVMWEPMWDEWPSVQRALGITKTEDPIERAGRELHTGIQLAEVDQWHEAIRAYKIALSLNPDLVAAHVEVATALFKINKFAEATKHLVRAAELKPTLLTFERLALLNSALPNWESAGEAAAKAIDLGSKEAVMWRLLGSAEALRAQNLDGPEAADHWMKAEEAFRAAIRRAKRKDPALVDSHELLGSVLHKTSPKGAHGRKRRLEEAIEHFKEAARHNPQNSRIHNNLGAVYADLRQNSAAISSFKEALEVDENNATALRNLGAMYLRRAKDVPQDRETLAKAVEIDPDVAETWNLLGAAHARCEELVKAKNCFARALKLDRTLAEARSNLKVMKEAIRTAAAKRASERAKIR